VTRASQPRPAARRQGAAQDRETPRRLLAAAAELFAERGFAHVSVREICRAASANVASVNYHFGDKLGLYGQVVELAIATMREAGAAGMRASGSAEERLRVYVRVFVERLVGGGQRSWIYRLMNREMEHPTPALDRVVAQAIRPRLEYLGGLVAELMGCPPRDARVLRVVASIQGQCMIYARAPVVARLAPDWRPTPQALAELSDHVAEFSLAGIHALARRSPARGGARARSSPRLLGSARDEPGELRGVDAAGADGEGARGVVSRPRRDRHPAPTRRPRSQRALCVPGRTAGPR